MRPHTVELANFERKKISPGCTTSQGSRLARHSDNKQLPIISNSKDTMVADVPIVALCAVGLTASPAIIELACDAGLGFHVAAAIIAALALVVHHGLKA